MEARPVSKREPQDDAKRTAIFATEMQKKWARGRATYGTEYKVDPFDEAMDECLDLANYAMEIYFRIKALKEKLGAGKD